MNTNRLYRKFLADSESIRMDDDEFSSRHARPLFTAKLGLLTAWLRDVSLIVLAWKAISFLSSR